MLYQSFLNNPNSSNENAYKSYKNKLTHSLRVAKRLYYEKQIEKLKSNVKATCTFLKEAYFQIIFVICLLLQVKYILIKQEIPTFSIYLIVELIFENSQFGFKVLRFSTR